MEKLKEKKPSIRFPEFKDGWEFKNGSDVFETVSNKNHNSDLPILAISQEFGAVPREMINYQISVTEKSVANYKVVDVGDYIISLRSFQGGIEYSNYKGICSPAYIILRPFIEIDRDFFRYYFKTYKYIQQLNSKLEGIRDGKMISYKYFSEIPLPFPTLPEQKRIASLFTVLDKKIAELKQKKALLEQYKKGVMQKLFSQELRFKDENGKEFPKWTSEPLGDLLDYIQPTKYLVEDTEYDDSYSTPVLTAGKSFILGYTNESFGIFNEELPVIIFDDFTTGTQFVDFPFKAKSSAMKILVPKNDSNIYFVYEAMQLIEYAIGGHERHWISKYSKIEIPCPSPKEQKIISDFLNLINKKIQQTEHQIQQTQEWKKGLLQNMCI